MSKVKIKKCLIILNSNNDKTLVENEINDTQLDNNISVVLKSKKSDEDIIQAYKRHTKITQYYRAIICLSSNDFSNEIKIKKIKQILSSDRRNGRVKFSDIVVVSDLVKILTLIKL